MTKTKQTLKKRLKISKSGKILKLQNDAGHLKVKWNAKKSIEKKAMKYLPQKVIEKRLKKCLEKQAER